MCCGTHYLIGGGLYSRERSVDLLCPPSGNNKKTKNIGLARVMGNLFVTNKKTRGPFHLVFVEDSDTFLFFSLSVSYHN